MGRLVLSRWKCLLAISAASTTALLLSLYVDESRNSINWRRKMTQNTDANGYNISFVEDPSLVLVAGNVSAAADGGSWRLIQERRQRHLSETCSRLVTRRWTASELKTAARQADTLFVDDKRKYIYCLVPKVACTSWTRVLFVASGKVRETDPNKIPQNKVNWLRHIGRILRPLAKYSADAIEYRLQNYYKFMFVRHPFERLLSAYRDRIKGDHAAASRLLSREIVKYRPSTVKPPVRNRRKRRRRRHTKGGVSFADFIRYVADQSNDPHTSNQHWRPMTDLCHPCHVRYDFVGHYDTIQTDAAVVLDRIQASDRVRFPFDDPDNRRRMKTNEVVRNTYGSASGDDVTRLTSAVYRDDMELFGYGWSGENGTSTALSWI